MVLECDIKSTSCEVLRRKQASDVGDQELLTSIGIPLDG